MKNPLTPTTFHRHNRPLRTLLLESQVWFCAREMGRLMGWPLNERTTRKLDPDQRRTLTLATGFGDETELMVSESGVYAMLVHHYHAENRELRQWLTNEVVPCLRDECVAPGAGSPCLSFLQWPGLSVSMLHWRSEAWIRLRDMPRVVALDEFRGGESGGNTRSPWWKLAVQALRLG